jgi:MULE transposase domain
VSTHPTLRHQGLSAKSSQIENQLQQGASTRQIMRGLHQTGESGLKAQDIYNLRKNLRKKFLKGKTPIQALISQLPENGDWIFNYETGEDHVIHALFCTHRTSLDNLRLNPYVLFMDCTYKTNRYRMPLLDIVRSTACKSTFYVSFAFVSNERESSYEFVLKNLTDIYRQLTLPSPKSILTDKDKALLNAVSKVFPQTDTMLCRWHINKNLLAKACPILPKETARTLAGDSVVNQRQLLVANDK